MISYQVTPRKTHKKESSEPRASLNKSVKSQASDKNNSSKQNSKFMRKPDTVRVQRKRKVDQQLGILCFLTPKNCQQKNKSLKKLIQHSRSNNELNTLADFTSTNESFFQCKEKHSQSLKKNSNVGIKKTNSNPIHNISVFQEGFNTKRQQINALNKVGKVNTMKENVAQQESNRQEAILKTNCKKLQSQVQKFKKKSEFFSSMMQKKQEQLRKMENQKKVLKKQLQNTKKMLVIAQQESIGKDALEIHIKSIQKQLKEFQLINSQLKKSQQEQATKLQTYQEQIRYLKGTVQDLNSKIQSYQQMQLNQMPCRASSRRHNTSFTGTQFCTLSTRQIQIENQQRSVIKELNDQIKYLHVQVNMLKRIKLDVNKQNEEFKKLQRQNKLLKSKIFRMMTQMEQEVISSHNNEPFRRNHKKKPSKFSEVKSNSSGDVFSLNLSVSTQGKAQQDFS